MDCRAHRLPAAGAPGNPRRSRRRRGLHQRRHPVQPPRPLAGARHGRRDARRTARPAARAGLRRRPLQRREVRPTARPGARRGHPDPVRPVAPDAGAGARGGRAGVSRRRPGADGCGRDGRHHGLRRDRPGAKDRGCVRPLRHLAARRRGVRRRAAGLASTAAPPRRDRARRLRDRRLPQDLVPSGLGECGDRPRRPHDAPRHASRRLPEPAGDHRSEPGRQEPADHAPVRRAQAVDDPAHHGSGLRRRLLRRSHRPGPAGSCGDGVDARDRGRRSAEPEHPGLPLPP